MKNILLAVVLSLATKTVHATVNQGVIATAASKLTIYSVCVSSQTPLDLTTLDGGTAASENWLNICVQNLDTTAAIYVGDAVTLSTVTATTATPAHAGVLVPAAASSTTPASPVCFPVLRAVSFYARTGKTTACSAAVVGLER